MEIKTEIIIERSVEQVWKVLTSFTTYAEWNPFVKSLVGKVEVGSQIEVEIDGMKFKPTVLAVRINEELRWLGYLWFKGVFDGEHIFKLERIESQKTRFVHAEKFKGILVPFFKRKLLTETKAGFEAMNRSLKERVEGMSRG